jgi:hypothetical protein
MFLKYVPFNKVKIKKLAFLCDTWTPTFRYLCSQTLFSILKKTRVLFKIYTKIECIF